MIKFTAIIRLLIISCVCLSITCGCEDRSEHDVIPNSNSSAIKHLKIDAAKKGKLESNYTTYLIKKGEHSSGSSFRTIRTNSLKFETIFDESAKYTLANSSNQGDLNKLYGLSDCGSYHHTNSARFGWRWYNNQLQIYAYVYVKGSRYFKEVGVIELNKSYQYEIAFNDGNYVFRLNGFPDVVVPRGCGGRASGYKLYPYFGGNEVAPHNITIKIRDL